MGVGFRNELRHINCLYKELNDIYHEICVKLKMSDSAFIILYGIVELGDGCLQKDISDRYYISRQTINSATKKLADSGYVMLKQGKRREMHLFLTPEGKQLVNDKIEPVINMENNVFEEMCPNESSEFLRLTQKYVSLYRKKANEL